VKQNRIGIGQAERDEASVQGSPPKAENESRSSGTFRVRVQVPSALEGFDLQPRLLLGLPENSARSELARALRGSGRMHVVEFDPSRADWSASLPPQEVDIAVLHASCLNLNSAALTHDPDFGYPELVFAVDDRCQAQRLALLSRGYRHVISADHLATWLYDHLASLCRLARARRVVLGACPAKTPVADLTLGTGGTGSMNLHLAETHFRETFLRALLTEHGSRGRAADAAGVPYRSFCEMLRKLGI
jgi:hypothetical protein